VQSSSPEFWQNQSEASEKMKKLGELQKELEEISQLEKLLTIGQKTNWKKTDPIRAKNLSFWDL